MVSRVKGETFSTAGMIIFTFFREAFETLAVPSLCSTVPSLLHSDLLNMSMKKRSGQKNLGGGKRNWGGDVQRSQGEGGREKELIIQIQSLKGKCVFQAVKMING